MIDLMETAEDLFEKTRQDIREILKSDMLKNVKKFVYKEHEFGMEQEDIQEMLPNIQAINLGVLNEVVVKDKDGNEVTMTAEEYIKRNDAGFKNKAKEEVDLSFLNELLDKIQTFAEFVHFGSLEMAKAKYIPEPEPEPEEEPVELPESVNYPEEPEEEPEIEEEEEVIEE